MGCLCVKDAKPEVDDTQPAKYREGDVLLTGYIKCADVDSDTQNPAVSNKEPYGSEQRPQSQNTWRQLQQADKGTVLHHQEIEDEEHYKVAQLQNHHDRKYLVQGRQLLQYEEPWSEHEQNRETGEQLHHLDTAREVKQDLYSREEEQQPRALHEKELEPQQEVERFQERRGDRTQQRQVKSVGFGQAVHTTPPSSHSRDTKRHSDGVVRHLDHSISFRSFTPLEIQLHNTHAGWVEWVPHKGKVYDGNRFKSHFAQYVQGRSRGEGGRSQELAWIDCDHGKERELATFPFNLRYNLRHIPAITSPEVWNHNGVQVLRYHGLSEEEIRREVSPFQMGYIRGTVGSAYWDSVRSDVAGLIKDISSEAEQTPAVRHYFELLRRWHTKYRDANPPHQHLPPHTDLNQLNFPMTCDPASLRPWLSPRQPSDLKSAHDNTGDVQTDQGNDLKSRLSGVTETFLQGDSGFVDLNFDIEGEAAWEVLPVDVVQNEVMTPDQEATEETRNIRKDFQDPEGMRRRREELGQHFIHKRSISPDVMKTFLGWADLMERNRLELQQLC